MTTYIIRRLVSAVVTFFLITLISFLVIQLPPGDVVSNWVRQQEAATGQPLPPETIESLRRAYGFDEPLIIQYFKWIDGFPSGDFGFSIEYSNAPVSDILAQRTGLTIFLGVATLFISWGLAIPFGIYAATHKNSRWDYILSTLSFVGISTPNFSGGGHLSVHRCFCIYRPIIRAVCFRRSSRTRPGRGSACWISPSIYRCRWRYWVWAAWRAHSASCAPICWIFWISSLSRRRAPKGCVSASSFTSMPRA